MAMTLRIEGYWLASGILGLAGSTLRRVIDAGADAVVTKSIGLEPRAGHPGPILTTSHGGLINAVGLSNPGIVAFSEEMRALADAPVPVVLSIFGRTADEIEEVAVHAVEYGPDGIELNLSCPHAEISQIAHSPDLTHTYVSRVRDVVKSPLLVKITPNASDPVAVGRAAEEAGADAVVAANTLRAMKIDIYQRRPVLGNKVGGLSGPPLFPVALRCVYDLYGALSIPIVGVGGVSCWQDAVEMHLAGASAIEIGTAVLTGLEIFQRVKQGVYAYLQEEGFSSVSEIIGVAWM